MRNYLWVGVVVGIILSVVVIWVSGTGANTSPSLLSQGMNSVGQLLGWTEASTNDATKASAAGKQSSSKSKTIPKETFVVAKPLIRKTTKDDFGAPAVKEPVEWIQVEGIETNLQGVQPAIARGIMDHIIPKDIAYRPNVTGTNQKASVAKVVLTALPVDGPPRSRRVVQEGEVKVQPFSTWKSLDAEEASETNVPVMPFAEPGQKPAEPPTNRKPSRIREVEVEQPPVMPFADE